MSAYYRITDKSEGLPPPRYARVAYVELCTGYEQYVRARLPSLAGQAHGLLSEDQTLNGPMQTTINPDESNIGILQNSDNYQDNDVLFCCLNHLLSRNHQRSRKSCAGARSATAGSSQVHEL